MTSALLPAPRYRLSRAGIRNVWQYDEQEFAFGDGRLLLRGKNGAGKSKALEMLLPYLLDGDARALDATGTGRTTLTWLMLDGFEQTNRLGHLWVEFQHTGDDGEERFLTLGTAIRASKSTQSAKAYFFVTPLRVGHELQLTAAGQPIPVDKLREAVGAENVTDRAVEHRARVARELFGLTDPGRYRNLTQLLHRLRRPTIGDRIESGGLVGVLGETLPGLDDDTVDKVARSLDDLDAVRTDLGRLERTDAALRTFLGSYRGYLHGVLRRRAHRVGTELDRLTERRRAAGDAQKEAAALRQREEQAAAQLDALHDVHETARTELEALRAGAAYRSLEELAERRATVAALHTAATTAFTALRRAHDTERGAAHAVTEGARRIGEQLIGLSSWHRELHDTAERAGLDPVHLGEPVASSPTVLAPPAVTELTGPDGDPHLQHHGPVRAVDPVAAGAALRAWEEQLTAAGPLAGRRLRAVGEVARLSGAARDAATRAQQYDAERERCEEQAEEATRRVGAHRDDVVRAGTQYAAEVQDWAGRIRAELGAPLPDDVVALTGAESDTEAPFSERALPAETAADVARAAEEILDPFAAALTAERDTLALRAGELEAEQQRLRSERDAWERRTDPEPPRPLHRAAERATNTGAPFYRLVDFADGTGPGDRAGLEAALEASGLLDAWVTAEGALLDPATRDTLLAPSGAPPSGATLATVLRPVAAPDCKVGTARIEQILACVALVRAGAGAAPDPSALGLDGSWRLGVLSGFHTKERAEYVGAEVRAATRRRRLAELDGRLAVVQRDLTLAQEQLHAVDGRRSALTAALRALRALPSGRRLGDAWVRLEQAEQAARERATAASRAAREAEAARAAAVAARREAEAAATAHALPVDPEGLERVRDALNQLGAGLEKLRQSVRTAAGVTADHATHHDRHRDARAARQEAEADYRGHKDRLDEACGALRVLEQTVGAAEQQILAQEKGAERRVAEAARDIPRLERELEGLRENRIRADERAHTRQDELTAQEGEVIGSGRALRTALAMPEVGRGAGLTDPPPGAQEPADAAVRARIQALRDLVTAVRDRLDPERRDVTDTTLLNRHTALRDQLSGGFDAILEEREGIKVCRLVDDHGPHDVALVAERIAGQATDARERLTEREREVFQRFLTGELGDHLSAQVLAATALVAALNDTLRSVRTSHGLGVELDWRLDDGVDADVRAAVELLRSPSGLRTREQTEQLREVLQRRIEDARRADPAAGYAAHLRSALDYRRWFTFHAWVVDDAAPGRRRRLTGRTGLSQGEQRVLSYLVLFAAAAAHFTTLAEYAPHAPRLIVLDDAFAKVDEPTHGRLCRILVDLDLDFVLTSERLMGNWPDVPSLHIYECLRDPHVRGVATLHYSWNGRRRRLMPV
ncbi:TIGR02680 family protein [Streptomyces sp. NPDC051286]|uniref:TIGR02680 family protein n=1 Tax=Streptomyces sp. NPDC051286 TaxID=3365647 RepID=UPI00378B0917